MLAAGHILLLEDDPDIRGLLECVFAADGHRVDVCTTPDQVLERAGEAPGAVAVVDFWGRSYRSLAADERDELTRLARAVPTVLVTGRDWANREAPDGLGLVAIFMKPFDVYDLAARVSLAVEQMSAGRVVVHR